MQGVWETIDFTWWVFAGSVEILGYIGIALFAYIVMIEMHEQRVRHRIERESRDEMRAEREAHGLRVKA